MKIMKTLNRNPGVQSKTIDFTPRMVQFGNLVSCCGRLHLKIMKFYDRAIAIENNLKYFKLPQRVNGCEIIIMFIRGKQLGPGAADKDKDPCVAGNNAADEAAEKMFRTIDHGGLDHKHSSEKEVAELTMTLVARKIDEVKTKYYADVRRYNESGFDSGSHAEIYSHSCSSAASKEPTEGDSDDDCSDGAEGKSDFDTAVLDNKDGADASKFGDENLTYDAEDEAEKKIELHDCCPHLPSTVTTRFHRCNLHKTERSSVPFKC
jgi:hypothetical protein